MAECGRKKGARAASHRLMGDVAKDPGKEGPAARHPFFKACQKNSQTVIQLCMWFMEEPSQFYVGQTTQSLTCSIMEKPHRGLDDCLRMLLPCFRIRMSAIGAAVAKKY